MILSIFLVIFFFLVSFLIGRAVMKVTKIQIPASIPVVSLVLGLVVVCLVLFLSGFLIPVSVVSVVSLLCFGAFVSYLLLKSEISLLFSEITSLYPRYWSGREWLIALFFIILAVWLFGRALFIGPDGQIIAGDRLVWVDWPLHIGMAANFAWGGNIPPQNPTFAGIPLIYPFFSDFLSGMLLLLGANIPVALNLPGIVLTLCFFSLFVSFGKSILGGLFYSSSDPANDTIQWKAEESRSVQDSSRLSLSRAQSRDSNNKSLLLAFGALFLSLFWGGLGFIFWFQEAFSDETQLVETLLAPVREYTFWSEKGFWFFTFLYSEILPQRAFLFGLPLFFLILLLIKQGWDKGHRPNFLLAGILTGILPFFHTHAFLSLVFLETVIVFIGGIVVFVGKLLRIPHQVRDDIKRRYLEALFLFGVPFVILTFFQVPLLLQQSSGFPFEFGWLKAQENFFLFWFKNTGLFIPLFLIGLWRGKFFGFTKLIGIASWILFILPNLFRFAPWGYDNLKIFTFWYLIGSFFVIAALNYLWQLRSSKLSFDFIWPVFTLCLFISLTLSGIVEVSRLIDTPSKQIGLWGKEDQEFATLLRTKTKGSDIFLAAAIHDHPVVTLAGRKTLLGFPGNSWSWGIKGWDEREKDIHTMFQGGEKAQELWKKYKINYIVIGDRERYFEKNLDELFISQNTKLILEKAKTKVYKIN